MQYIKRKHCHVASKQIAHLLNWVIVVRIQMTVTMWRMVTVPSQLAAMSGSACARTVMGATLSPGASNVSQANIMFRFIR